MALITVRNSSHPQHIRVTLCPIVFKLLMSNLALQFKFYDSLLAISVFLVIDSIVIQNNGIFF